MTKTPVRTQPENSALELASGSLQTLSDRRIEQRYCLQEPVRLRSDCGTFLPVKSVDFSLSGMRLECPQSLPLGATCQVLYTHPSRGHSWVEGTVLYCSAVESGFHLGLQLQFRSGSDRLPYQQMVLSLTQ